MVTTTETTQAPTEHTQEKYINKILGPPPGKQARIAQKMFLYSVAYILFCAFLFSLTDVKQAASGFLLITSLGLYASLFLIFISAITWLACGSSYEQRKHHQVLEEKLLSGEIQPDFYYPADGNAEYLILDHKNGKLWAGLESADIADIKSIQITTSGKNQKGYHILFYFRDITLDPIHLCFAAEEGPKAQMIYDRIKEELNFS